MPETSTNSVALDLATARGAAQFDLSLPDPDDDEISEYDFQRQIEAAWLVCDRFDLQSEIWRGRILRAVRDREKARGNGRGIGFLNWLRDREISKSQAYRWIELADSADSLLDSGCIEPENIEQFSKSAFVETAKAAPEVQQTIASSAREGSRIQRRDVRRLSEEWAAMTSDLVPEVMKRKASDNTVPARYLAPFVKEVEKLPPSHQTVLQAEVAESPDIDTLKAATASARYLSRYLEAAARVQALESTALNVESALEESLRLGCLNQTAELVSQAAQLEQTLAKFYSTWKRLGDAVDRLEVQSGASTPHLRSLLTSISQLSDSAIEFELGNGSAARKVRLQVEDVETTNPS
ncbi:MAG: hypothetical protein AAFY57_04545 [Cyanobacteria bacterium J06642_2]